MTCPHVRKVYSGERFAVLVPKWSWACEDCGETGLTQQAEKPEPIDMLRYADAVEKRDTEAAQFYRRMWARYVAPKKPR